MAREMLIIKSFTIYIAIIPRLKHWGIWGPQSVNVYLKNVSCYNHMWKDCVIVWRSNTLMRSKYLVKCQYVFHYLLVIRCLKELKRNLFIIRMFRQDFFGVIIIVHLNIYNIDICLAALSAWLNTKAFPKCLFLFMTHSLFYCLWEGIKVFLAYHINSSSNKQE